MVVHLLTTLAGAATTLKARAMPAAALTVPLVVGFAVADLRNQNTVSEVGIAITTLLLAAALCVAYWAHVVVNYEAYFKAQAWTWNQQDASAKEKRRLSLLGQAHIKDSCCAFTGEAPNFLCLSCKQFVKSKFYHRDDSPTGSGLTQLLFMGLGQMYPLVDRASVLVSEKSVPTLARVELDEALDFEGDFLTGRLAHCCAACYNRYRLWHLLPRLATCSFFSSIVFMLSSLAIKIDVLSDAGSVWVFVKPVLLTLAQFLAGCTLTLVLESVYASKLFLENISNICKNKEIEPHVSPRYNGTGDKARSIKERVDIMLKVFFAQAMWW